MGTDDRGTRGAFAKVFLRSLQGSMGSSAATITEAQIKSAAADELSMTKVKRPTCHTPTLHFDFSVVDVVTR